MATGLLYDRLNNQYRLAPVFDFASCLFPQIFKGELKNILKTNKKLKDVFMYFQPLNM